MIRQYTNVIEPLFMNGKNLDHSKIMVVFAVDKGEVLFVYNQILLILKETNYEKR